MEEVMEEKKRNTYPASSFRLYVLRGNSSWLGVRMDGRGDGFGGARGVDWGLGMKWRVRMRKGIGIGRGKARRGRGLG
jgi:hypothetical protein